MIFWKRDDLVIDLEKRTGYDKKIAYYIYIAGLLIGVSLQVLGLTLGLIDNTLKLTLITYGIYAMQITPLILLTALSAIYMKNGDRAPALASLLGLIAIIMIILYRIGAFPI